MTQSKQNIFEAIAWILLAVGVLLFLNATHSTGEALERLSLIFSSSAVSVLGAVLALFGIVALFFLHVGDIKRRFKHR